MKFSIITAVSFGAFALAAPVEQVPQDIAVDTKIAATADTAAPGQFPRLFPRPSELLFGRKPQYRGPSTFQIARAAFIGAKLGARVGSAAAGPGAYFGARAGAQRGVQKALKR
jgi:hypothetical protein